MGPMGWVPKIGTPPTQSPAPPSGSGTFEVGCVDRALAEIQGTQGMGHRSDDNDGHCFLWYFSLYTVTICNYNFRLRNGWIESVKPKTRWNVRISR